jgi:hypothetical protein
MVRTLATQSNHIMNKSALRTIASAVRAIAKQIETLELKEAPSFDRAALETVYATIPGMSKETAAKLIDGAEKEFTKVNGDGASENRNAVFTTLETGFMDICKAHNLKRTRSARNDVTAKDITKAQCEEAIAKRSKGEALSTIAEALNTDYVNLRLAIIRELGEDAISKANEAGKLAREQTESARAA